MVTKKNQSSWLTTAGQAITTFFGSPVNFLSGLSMISLAAVVLLPLFVLPWGGNLQFFKQVWLVGAVGISLACWCLSQFFKEDVSWRWGSLHTAVVSLVVAASLATWFSSYSYGSLVGLSSVATSLLTLLAGTALFFLLANGSDRGTSWLKALATVSIFANLIFLARLLGGPILNWQNAASLSLLGSANDTVTYLAVCLPLFLSLLTRPSRPIFFYILVASVLTILVSLYLVALPAAWYLVLASVITWLLFVWRFTPSLPRASLVLSLVAVVLALSALFQPTPFYKTDLPIEINPSWSQSWQVATATWRENPKNLWLGRGPSTYSLSFSQHRPAALNYAVLVQDGKVQPLWSTRFQQPANLWFNFLTDFGMLGSVAALSIIIFSGWLFWRQRASLRESEGIVSIGLWSSLIAIVVATGFRPINVSLIVLFWILLGLVARTTTQRTLHLVASSSRSLAVIVVTILFLAGVALSSALETRRLLAEASAAKANVALATDKVAAVNALVRAVDLAPFEDRYWRQLTDAARQYALTYNLSQPADEAGLTAARRRVIFASQRAYQLHPQDVANVSGLAATYQGAAPFFRQAANLSVAKYREAASFDPTNPVWPTEEARSHLLAATYAVLNAPSEKDQVPSEEVAKQFAIVELDQAAAAVAKALSLKKDYSPARFVESAIAVRQGRVAEALAELTELAKTNTQDAPLHYEIGLLYYRTDNLVEAKKYLESAVARNPQYANALYFLGLIADASGDKAEAISKFEVVAQLNPEASDVKVILDNLRAGRDALDNTIPESPAEEPVSENQ